MDVVILVYVVLTMRKKRFGFLFPYNLLAAAPLASKGSIFERQKNSLKPYPDSFKKINSQKPSQSL